MFEMLHDSLSQKRDQIKTMYMMDIDNFKQFPLFWQMTAGGPYDSTMTLDSKKDAEENGDAQEKSQANWEIFDRVADGINIFSFIPNNPFYFMVMSSDNIREGQYSFYYGNSPLFIFEETSEQTEENIEEITTENVDNSAL